MLSIKVMALLGVIALAGELVENLLGYFGIKKMGGGRRSVFGAFIGGIAGSILGAGLFGVGIILGGLAGIFLGACLMDLTRSGSLFSSLKVGFGGVVGSAGSVLVKIFAALLMIQIIVAHVWKGSGL